MNEILLINIITTALCAILGACISSFVNVTALRRVKGESFIAGRSHCPSCGATLRWFELIPIISWLVQLGRCRACKEPISPRYLIAEIIGALASALCYVRFGFTWMTPFAVCVVFILLAIALHDLSSKEIPNGLVIALIPFALLSFFLQGEIELLARGIGFVSVSLPMLLLALVVSDAFGGGDIKLMAVCGFMLGWINTLLAFFIAVLLGGGFAIYLIVSRQRKRNGPMVFGPALCVGVTVALLFGTDIVNWYLRFFLL